MTDASPADNRALELIATAGLQPEADELAVFEMMYPLLRAKADTVHNLELGYEV